jgi:hypothetical protein
VSKKWEKMMGVMYAYGSQHVTVKQLGLWLHLMPKEKEVWTTGDVDFFRRKETISHEKNVGRVARTARWFIFKQKFPIWLNFGASCNRRC